MKLIGSISFQVQQRKQAEELTNGMALRNAAFEQLPTKSKKKRSSRSLQKLKVKKLLLGLPNVLNKNNRIRPVLCAILYPLHSKHPRLGLSKWKSKRAVTSVIASRRRCVL